MVLETKGPTINWGILGTGRVAGNAMAPGIRRSRNGRLLAVASRNTEKAGEFAGRFGAPRAYGSYEALLADPEVQAVYIALPNALHREWTIRAAEAGKHVLCEKPLAIDVQEAGEMVETCRRQGVLLMEAFAHRFQPQTLEVKRLADEGRIGRVIGMVAMHLSAERLVGDVRLSRELGGGALMDVGCYCVNTARFVMGAEPVSVFARGDFGDESGVDLRMLALMEFPGGRFAQFDCGFQLSPNAYHQSYEVVGTSGRIHVPKGFAQVETYRRGEIVEAHFAVSDPSGTEERRLAGVHQWQLEAEYFADRVLLGEPIGFPAEDGLANTKAMDAIYTSAREGKPVALAG